MSRFHATTLWLQQPVLTKPLVHRPPRIVPGGYGKFAFTTGNEDRSGKSGVVAKSPSREPSESSFSTSSSVFQTDCGSLPPHVRVLDADGSEGPRQHGETGNRNEPLRKSSTSRHRRQQDHNPQVAVGH
jgi:hypothetical protein